MVGVNTPARRPGGAALCLWWIGLMSLKIGNKTEMAIDTQLICFRRANTLSECASSLNNGECRERLTGCEDCNKVVWNRCCPILFLVPIIPQPNVLTGLRIA